MSFLRKQTPEEKEEKEREQLQKFLDKYHLSGLSKEDLLDLKEIAKDFWGLGAIKMGAHFSGNSAEVATVDYLSIITRQNFIIIRKLSEICNKLK